MIMLFQGYYGQKNTGDNAFVEVAAWGGKKYWGDTYPIFLTKSMPQIQTECKDIGMVYNRLHLKMKGARWVMCSDALIIAGGSVFHSRMNLLNPRYIAGLKSKFSDSFRYGAIGVSLGPYKNSQAERENIELLKRFDFLTLRDEASYQLALSYDFPYQPIESFDLAALLPEVYMPGKKDKVFKSGQVIGVILCCYEGCKKNGDVQNEERRNGRILELLLEVLKKRDNITIKFIVFNGHRVHGDRDLTLRFISRISSFGYDNFEFVDYHDCVHDMWEHIRKCDCILSVRLHGAIFACFNDKPFMLVEYHRKCSDFLESVGYNGIRLYDAEFDVANTAIQMCDWLDNKSAYMTPLNLDESKIKALKSFTETKQHMCTGK